MTRKGLAFFALVVFFVLFPSQGADTASAEEKCVEGVSFFDAFSDHPTGLAWDGNHLWHADWEEAKIYELDTSGNIVSSFKWVTGTIEYPTGLAWDGSHLWLADGNTRKIYELDTSGNAISSFTAPGDYPWGLAWDGNHLWLTDQGENAIYELDTSGKVISSFTVPYDNTYPHGLAWDGSHLWLADSDIQQLSVIKLTTSGNVLSRRKLYRSDFSILESFPRGLAWDGSHLWCTGAEHCKIYELRPNTIYHIFENVNRNRGYIDIPRTDFWEGATVTVTAEPKSGYEFDHWSGDVSGTSSSIDITMDPDKSVTAHFTSKQYTLSTFANPSGGGSVSLSPPGGVYDDETTVTVTADPAPGYEFDHWSGDTSGTSTSVDVIMYSDKSITANFTEKENQYNLAVADSSNGSVSLSPSGGTYDEGTIVTATATPDPGYEFYHWSGDLSGPTPRNR